MKFSPEETEFLALLVHRGFIGEADARELFAQEGEERSLLAVLADRGLLAADEARRLFRNKVGERPRLTRYEIKGRLGEGKTALVFKALDRRDQQVLALKILREELAANPLKLERFIEEAELLTRLQHPGIVKGYRVAQDSGTYFLAMELLDGETLEERLLRGETLTENDALSAIHQVAKTLCYLRGEGLIHRDIKPGNLMLHRDGQVRLIDLGFAAKIGAGGSDMTLGTVHYIAPEQARGEGDLDSRVDIYALGATLYHLCTGETPFQGAHGQEVLEKQVFTELSSQKIKDLNLSQELHYLIEKMMAKEKEIRYQDPEELVADIEDKCAEMEFLKPQTQAAPRLRRTRGALRARARGSRPRRRRR